MSEFPMCDKCAEEYNSPLSRRYDAQPVCCNECGPEVYILGGLNGIKDGADGISLGIEGSDIIGRDAITLARKTIIDGGVITNAYSQLQSGSQLQLLNGGIIVIRTNSVFSTPVGSVVNATFGKICKSSDFSSF